MNEPELRCLICDRVLAEGSNSPRPRENCGQCGKSILAVGESVELTVVPTVDPVKPPPIPEVLPAARVVAPTVRPVPTAFRPPEVPESEPPKPKLAFALFVAFLTLVAIMLSLTVIGYAIVTGLQKAAKRIDPPIPTKATVPANTGK